MATDINIDKTDMVPSQEAHLSTEKKQYPELSPKPTDKRPMIFGILTIVVLLLIFGGIAYLLFTNPEATAIIRDIFIIFLGLGVFLIILLLIVLVVIIVYLILKVNDLVQLLDREIKPILSRIQDTMQTVKGTTNFISDKAVDPVISTVSTVAAAKAIVNSLFRRNS